MIRQSTAMKVDLTLRVSPAQTQILNLLHQAWRMNLHPQEQISLEYPLMIMLIQVFKSFVLSHVQSPLANFI